MALPPTAGALTAKDLSDIVPSVPDGNLQEKLKKLCNSAFTSLQLMEPWSSATSDIEDVTVVIDRVREQSDHYYDALGSSISASTAGFTISSQCKTFCECLLDGALIEDIREYVSELQSLSKTALADALSSQELFRSVRVALVQATSEIGRVVRDMRASGTFSGGITFLQLPDPLLIQQDAPSESAIQIPTDRVARPIDDESAKSNLFQASQILVQLVDSTGVFVDWWSELHTRLICVEQKAKGIEPGRIVRLSVKMGISEWNAISEMYLHYNSIICRLQDYFPRTSAGRVAAETPTSEVTASTPVTPSPTSHSPLQPASPIVRETYQSQSPQYRSASASSPTNSFRSVAVPRSPSPPRKSPPKSRQPLPLPLPRQLRSPVSQHYPNSFTPTSNESSPTPYYQTPMAQPAPKTSTQTGYPTTGTRRGQSVDSSWAPNLVPVPAPRRAVPKRGPTSPVPQQDPYLDQIRLAAIQRRKALMQII